MASKTYLLLATAVVAAALIFSAEAADPDITSDFIVPAETPINADFFTFRGFREALLGGPNEGSFKATKATKSEFEALNGQSVSLVVLQFAPRGLNPLHTHPHSAELLTVVQGTLSVGFIDPSNKLYSQFLFKGDSFVFPKGLVHFQVNVESRYPAVAISAFGSANPEIVSLPKTIFGSGVEDWILAQSFNTTTDVIDKIIAANSG